MRAIYYDLPEVLPIAHRHFEGAGLLDRIELVAGALFAIKMLVNTETGGTYSRQEYFADLQAAGCGRSSEQPPPSRHDPVI